MALAMPLKDTLKQVEGIAQEIGRAMHRGLKLLHRLNPPAFLLEGLKPAVLFLQDGLLGIQQQTVRRIHAQTPFVGLRTVTETEFLAQ